MHALFLIARVLPMLIMGTVLGLRDTNNFDSDQRPKNYRAMILLLFPNASAPLTAMLTRLKDEPTDDPEFKIFTKVLPPQRTTQSGGVNSSVTSIPVATGGGIIFKAGHAVINERTLEVIWVTADPSGDTLTVVRGVSSTAAAMLDGDGLLIIGNANQEGAPIPSAISYDPVVVSNYTQIFRTTMAMTNTVKNQKLRWGMYQKEAKREALELHSIEMEKAFIWGTKKEDLTGTHPKRSTGGIFSFIATNTKDFAGTVTISAWDNFLASIFQYGSTEKLLLCGNTALNVLNQMARANYTVETTPTSETYGMKMTSYVTPFGTLQIKQHPLLSQNQTFNSWGFILDTKYLVYRYMQGRDTDYLDNRQNAGDDASKAEFLTECGLECQFEQTHGWFKNASAFAP